MSIFSPFSLLAVGLLLGIFPGSSLSLTNTGKLLLRSRSGRSEYTITPYKADFDLLRTSDNSRELGYPLLRTNHIDDGIPDEFSLSDPTFRSKRRRRQVQVQNSDFQKFSLCLPYFYANPLCRQVLFGLNNDNTAASGPSTPVAVPSSASTFYVSPSSSALSAPVPLASRNDLALNYYYQQQPPQPPQLLPQQPVVPLQVGLFQGPIPIQRQRQQYPDIHTKYPYPYPPSIIPESVVADSETKVVSNVTDGPVESPPVTTAQPHPHPQPDKESETVDAVGYVPESPNDSDDPPAHQQQQEAQQPSSTNAPASSPTPPPLPPSSEHHHPQPPKEVPVSPEEQQNDPSPQQSASSSSNDIHIQNMNKRLREKEDENRRLLAQLEQANQQIISYEQENAQYKDQYVRSEEANHKLRDRVQQLENTNQHLQEQNGQLQQVTAEQRTQINSLKIKAKDAKEQLENFQQKYTPLSQEVQQHRKEIEDFLIRIRQLGEENETCQKQVKLYQLKINYIQQQQQNDDPEAAPDAELSRMDAELMALQRKDAAGAGEPEQSEGEEPATTQQAIVPDLPPVTPENVAVKTENEFPGEAVQVPQRGQQTQQAQQPPQEKTVATAAEIARAQASRNTGVWEQPAGF